jgi:O-antigen/teichoic acid export membrane protein
VNRMKNFENLVTEAFLSPDKVDKRSRPQRGWRQKFPVAGLPLREIGWAGIASIVLQISILGTSVLIARLLGIADFGRFSAAMSVSGMFVGIATSGLGVAASRYTARYADSNPQRLGSVLALASGIAILTASAAACTLLFFGGYIARHVYNLPSLAIPLQFSSIYLFFVVLNGYQVGAAVGLSAFRPVTIVNAIQCFVSIVVVGASTAIWGVSGASLGMGIAASLVWLQYKSMLTGLLKQKGVILRYRDCTREMKVFWTFAMPSAVSGVIGAVGIWLATVLLVKSPSGIKEIALFNAAIIFRQCVLFAPTIMQKVLSISLSESYGRVDPSAYWKLYHQNVTYNLSAGMAIAFLLLLLKGPLLRIFGREFTDPNHVVYYVLLFAVVEVSATSFYQAIPAVGAMWYQVGVMILWVTALVTASSMLATEYGARGLALSYLAAWITAVIAYYGVSQVLLSNPERHLKDEGIE